MELFAKCVRKVDVVGFRVEPTFNNSNRMKTVLGGLLSIILFTLTCLGFVYFGRDMVTRSSPTINTVKQKVSNANIPFEDFPFFVTIADATGRTINQDPEFTRSVKMSAEFVRLDPAEDGGDPVPSYLVGPVVKCDLTVIQQKYIDLAREDGYDIEKSLCIDYNNMTYHDGRAYNGEVYIRNERLSVNSGLVTFNIAACDAKVDPGCRAYLERTGRFWVRAQMPNYFEVSSDFEDPIKKDFAVVSHDVNPNFFRKDKINFEINELVTDKGIILEDTFTDEYVSINSYDFSIDSFSETNRMVYQVVLSAKQIKNTTNRRYLKLQELMANVGGFIKASTFVASGICYNYSQFVLYCEINKAVSRINSQSLTKNNFIDKETSTKMEIKPKLTNMTKNTLKVSFCRYICASFSKRTRKTFQIDDKNAFRFVDLTYLIPQLTKLENLKIENSSD